MSMYIHPHGPSNGPDVELVAKNDSMCCYFGILQIPERHTSTSSIHASMSNGHSSVEKAVKDRFISCRPQDRQYFILQVWQIT